MQGRIAGMVLAATLACAPQASAGDAHDGAPGGAAVRAALAGKTLVALDGTKLRGDALRGEVVVVNFWATWCKPCRREMPRLAELDRTLRARGGRVVAISIDEDPENVRRFAKSLGLSIPLYVDGPKGLVRTLDLAHVPTTFVLDRDGVVVHRSTGSTDADLDRLASVAGRLAGGGVERTAGGAE